MDCDLAEAISLKQRTHKTCGAAASHHHRARLDLHLAARRDGRSPVFSLRQGGVDLHRLVGAARELELDGPAHRGRERDDVLGALLRQPVRGEAGIPAVEAPGDGVTQRYFQRYAIARSNADFPGAPAAGWGPCSTASELSSSVFPLANLMSPSCPHG